MWDSEYYAVDDGTEFGKIPLGRLGMMLYEVQNGLILYVKTMLSLLADLLTRSDMCGIPCHRC